MQPNSLLKKRTWENGALLHKPGPDTQTDYYQCGCIIVSEWTNDSWKEIDHGYCSAHKPATGTTKMMGKHWEKGA